MVSKNINNYRFWTRKKRESAHLPLPRLKEIETKTSDLSGDSKTCSTDFRIIFGNVRLKFIRLFLYIVIKSFISQENKVMK